jgi:HAE1 family hydrophobic/amphiphilic exporter-1
MEVGMRLDLLDQQTRVLEALVAEAVPEAVATITTAGSSGRDGGAAQGEVRVSLSPSADRRRSGEEIAEDLRTRLAGRVPGMQIRTRASQGQFVLERVLGSEEGLEVEVRGYDLEVLGALAERVAAVITTVPGVSDVDLSRELGTPQQQINIDRDKVADLGLTVRDVSDVLETAVAGSQAGEFRSEGNSYRIFVQLAEAEKRSIEEILDLTLSTAEGERVALRNLVTAQAGRGPRMIERKNQQRLVTVAVNVAGRDLGSVARDVIERMQEIPRPAGYELTVAGAFEEQERSFRELAISLGLALTLVYMVLACQYESLRDPLIVMFAVPTAAVGVLLTLFLTRTTLNVQSFIGCIMLGGIVVNNAILLVDQAGRLLRSGVDVNEAVAEAGRRRLRPILMTSLTTILALLPLALGMGEGADAQAAMARAVVGGLTASTLITLILVPCLYSLMHARARERAVVTALPATSSA